MMKPRKKDRKKKRLQSYFYAAIGGFLFLFIL